MLRIWAPPNSAIPRITPHPVRDPIGTREAKRAGLDRFRARRQARVVGPWTGRETGGVAVLAFGMVVLGVATFVGLLGFTALCDRV